MRCYHCESLSEMLFPVLITVKGKVTVTAYVCKPCYKGMLDGTIERV